MFIKTLHAFFHVCHVFNGEVRHDADNIQMRQLGNRQRIGFARFGVQCQAISVHTACVKRQMDVEFFAPFGSGGIGKLGGFQVAKQFFNVVLKAVFNFT